MVEGKVRRKTGRLSQQLEERKERFGQKTRRGKGAVEKKEKNAAGMREIKPVEEYVGDA